MADGSLPIVVTPEAFGRDAFDLTVVEGLTVRAMLVEAVRSGLPIEALNRTEIYVDGARLDRETALDHVLAADQVVNVVVEPMGGGGGRKDIGQILLTVAVIAVSAWVGGGAGGLITKEIWARAAAAAITLGGQALIASLYAPDSKTTKANDRYALQSASNQYRQWGPMPLALGEVVTAPDLAAKTFTQSQGDDVWMYGVLGVHYGPCEVSEVKIGDTLVSTMGPGDFRMVQHLEPGPRTFQLYPNDVDQLDLNEELKATPSSATPLVRAASSDGSRFDLDFFLPAGLYFQKDDGRVLTAHASVAVRYRPIDQTGGATGPWQSGPSWARTSATKDPIRVTHSVHLPHGRYEFELTRNRPDDGNDKRRDTIMVSAIKSVAFRKPVADETLSIIEFAVRATAINQGGLAPITCRIKPKCSTWTGGAWGAPVATSNPAALARWLLTGPAPAKPLLPAQADARLRVWHQLCEQYDWKCHLYLTEARTQSEALAILERAGRAGVFWDGTQLAASPWVEKPIPAQVFTEDNLKDHRWEIVYPDPVHALRVEFQNIEKGGEPDELFVYNDGYGEVADPANGIKAASLIEALTLDGQATPNRAYRDGRWKLGQRRHQRRIDTWTADVEHLISQYGSRVRLAWNRAGGGSARVRCRRWSEDGSAVVGLRLSAPVEMFAGVSYAVDLRTKGGLYDGVPIQTQPGVTREILFASARHPNLCPTAGDLIAFGEVEKVSEDVEIIAIEPGENLTAVLTGVRYVAPLLMAGETGPIPPLTSKLSGDRQANPPRPTLLGVTADAHAVRVSFDMPTWRGAPLSGFSVRWRAKGEEGEAGSWAPLPALDAAARELIAPPLREAPVESVEATRVEIEITAATVDGRVSPPLQVTVVKPVPGAPLASIWSVDAKGPDASGVSQPILIVRGEITDPNVAAVRIAWGLTVDGPWTDVYEGAPLTKALEIGNLTPGVEHFVAITHLSAQGVPSQFLVIGPRVPGQLISGDTTHLKGEPVQDVLDRLTDTATLADENRQAVAALEEVYGDTASAATSAAAAAASEAAAAQAKADALIAKAGAESSAGAAQTARTQAETARAGAETAQTSAANSATTATGAASTATTQAGIATTAKNDAQAASNAAVTAKNQASSFADAAGVSAAASQASSVTASTARDEALAALAQQGRLNLVQKSRVSAAPVAFPDTASGWGYRLVGGTTGSRISYVGPLKTNTPYSISFKARRVSGTTSTMNVDLFPDTLPERVFTVTSDQWTEYKWEGLTSAHADMTSENVQLRFFRASLPSGNTFEVADIKLEEGATASAWTPNPKDIELSASAAATSASNAAASETAAGASASAASTAKTQAETARGQAQTAATQASSSRDDAAGSAASASSSATLASNSRDAAAGSATAAAGSASTASTKATEAGNSAAAAAAAQVSASASRDQALKALLEQGRTNLVRRTRATAGQVVATSEGLSGWGFSMVRTGSDAQERSIAVGPLKQNTPYSLSFMARRLAGSGSKPISFDLFPDTLPQWEFDIQSNAWTRYTWENFSSDHSDMTMPSVLARFFRPNMEADVNVEIAAVKIEEGATATVWTPSPFDAADSASAAATSASSAAASETAAGQSASAAQGSATTAATQAGNASSFASQAAGSASDAAGSAVTASQASGTSVSARDAAIGARNDAQAAAATSVAQSSAATAAAAEAKLSANLAASVGAVRPNLLKNGGLEDGSVGMSGSGPLVVSDDPAWGRNIKNAAITSGTHSIIWPAIPVRGGARYTISGDTGYFHTGTGGNSYLDLIFYDANGTQVLDGPQKAINGPHDFSNAKERLQAHAVSVVAPADAVTARARAIFTNMNAPTFMGARRVKVEEGDLPATAFTSEASANQIAGRLAIVAEVAADAAEQIGSARFRVTGDGGAEPFDISLEAGPDGSSASLTAKAIRLRNIVNGQAINVVEVVGGKARFSGDVEIDGDLLLSGTINGRRVIIPDTVTPMAATYAAGSVGLNGTTETQVQEVWVTTQGGPVVIEFNGLVNMRHDPAGSFDAVMEVRRSPNAGTGIQMLYMSVPALGGGNDSVLGMYPLKLIDRPAAGTWRYFVTVRSTANNMSIQEVRQRFMSALEYRTNS